MPMVEERHERIDVGSAAAATRDDLVGDNGDRVFRVMESCVRLDDESEWQLRLLQERVCSWDGIQG